MPAGQRMILMLHDDHFARELTTHLTTKPEAIYRNVDVHFSRGQVEVYGEIRVLGWWVPATVWGNLRAQDCHIEALITDLSVGGALTPDFVCEEAGRLVQSELEKVLDGPFETLPICLESVQVLDGIAVVEGIKEIAP